MRARYRGHWGRLIMWCIGGFNDLHTAHYRERAGRWLRMEGIVVFRKSVGCYFLLGYF
jgi:hypothetical protein